MTCPACHAAHHGECWEDNGGCAVLGCAAAPAAAPPAPSPTVTGPSTAAPLPVAPPRGRRPLHVPALVALVIALGAGLGYTLVLQGEEAPAERAATGPAPAEATPEVTATPEPAPTVERLDDGEVVARLDRLLELSARGRALAASDPSRALANRRRVLREVQRLEPASRRLRRAIATFEQALEASIAANEARAAGLDPSLHDQRASSLKRTFCERVNPIAAEYGFGPYFETEI